jgi:hypothetical protein
MANLSGAHRPQALGVHRRDLDEDQHDQASRLGAEGRAPRRQGPARQVEDGDFSRRLAQRPHRCALLIWRTHQRRTLPCPCRAIPRPGPQARLCCRARHPRFSQRAKAVRNAIRASGARLVFLPKYSPDPNPIEQAFAKLKTLLRKVAARIADAVCEAIAELRRPSRQANAPTTSKTQDTRKSKSRMLQAEGKAPRITQDKRGPNSTPLRPPPRTHFNSPLRRQRCITVQRTSVPCFCVCERLNQSFIRRLVKERMIWARPGVWIPAHQNLSDIFR